MNQALFLRRRCKAHVPMGTGGATRAQVASAVREVTAFRCVLAEPLIERLGMLSAIELKHWLREIVGVLRRETGAHVHHRPFYPDFPEQVLAASEAQLYLNAVMHYLTLRRLPAAEHSRPAMLEGNFISRVIELGSVSEFESLLEPLVSSRTSLSEEEAADVAWFIRTYKSDVFRLLPEVVPFRENRALVGGTLLVHVADDTRVEAFLERNVETATDVLRLAVALSGGDVSLTTATTRFTAMKRSTRRLLLRLLDNIPHATEDLMRHAERWKRLAEVLHPGDYADKYPRALGALRAARRNEAPASFGSRVETLLARRHIDTLTPMLQSRPGEFARRLDVTSSARDGTRVGSRRIRGDCKPGVLTCSAAVAGPLTHSPPPSAKGVHTERRICQNLRHQGSTRTYRSHRASSCSQHLRGRPRNAFYLAAATRPLLRRSSVKRI
ncbi:hypothetical protein [Pseudomonas sp. H2_E05]